MHGWRGPAAGWLPCTLRVSTHRLGSRRAGFLADSFGSRAGTGATRESVAGLWKPADGEALPAELRNDSPSPLEPRALPLRNARWRASMTDQSPASTKLDPRAQAAKWKDLVACYQEPDRWRAAWQILNTY